MKNISLAIWRAQLRSAGNASRHDVRMRVAGSVAMVGGIALGIWSAFTLREQLQHWQVQGNATLHIGLWSLCLSTWIGMALLTILSVQNALRSDVVVLQFTLPISYTTRFRTLFGSFFLKQLWFWSLLQASVLCYVFVSQLGWSACSWFALLEVGIGATVLCALTGTLLVLRYCGQPQQHLARIGCAAFLIVLITLLVRSYQALSMQGLALAQQLRPEFGLLFCLGLLGYALGPGAFRLGQLYAVNFSLEQSKDRGENFFVIPGINVLIVIGTRWRNLLGGLFVKALESEP